MQHILSKMFIYSRQILLQLKEMRNQSLLTDMIIKSKSGKEYKIHSILWAACGLFNSSCEEMSKRCTKSHQTVTLSLSSSALDVLIEFMYSGNCSKTHDKLFVDEVLMLLKERRSLLLGLFEKAIDDEYTNFISAKSKAATDSKSSNSKHEAKIMNFSLPYAHVNSPGDLPVQDKTNENVNSDHIYSNEYGNEDINESEKTGINIRSDSEVYTCRISTKENLKLLLAKRSNCSKVTCTETGDQQTNSRDKSLQLTKHVNQASLKGSSAGPKSHVCCDLCGKFIRPKGYKLHMKVHAGVKDLTCETCGRSFRKRSTLTEHRQRMHSTMKKHKCPACGVSFALPWDLRRHLERHVGVTTFVCELCGASFAERMRWKNHQCILQREMSAEPAEINADISDNKMCTPEPELIEPPFENLDFNLIENFNSFMCEWCGSLFDSSKLWMGHDCLSDQIGDIADAQSLIDSRTISVNDQGSSDCQMMDIGKMLANNSDSKVTEILSEIDGLFY